MSKKTKVAVGANKWEHCDACKYFWDGVAPSGDVIVHNTGFCKKAKSPINKIDICPEGYFGVPKVKAEKPKKAEPEKVEPEISKPEQKVFEFIIPNEMEVVV